MEKIKHFIDNNNGKDILVIIIVILVGIVSFELGRLSQNSDKEGFKITYIDQNINKTSKNTLNLNKDAENLNFTQNATKTTNFIASKKGTKFYGITCSAGKSIKEENKIYFQTADEAIRAGYEASTACK